MTYIVFQHCPKWQYIGSKNNGLINGEIAAEVYFGEMPARK